MRLLRSRAGITLAEAMVATSVMSLLTLGGMSLLVGASSYSLSGFQQSIVDSDTNLAMLKMVKALRMAMGMTVDADGRGITYYLPSKDVNGNYILPLAPDAGHRFYLSGTQLLATGVARPVLKDVVTTDPRSGSTYRLFTEESAVAGVRIVSVKVIVSRNYGRGNAYMRLKERVLLRNYLP